MFAQACGLNTMEAEAYLEINITLGQIVSLRPARTISEDPALDNSNLKTVFLVIYTYFNVQKLIMRKEWARICLSKCRDFLSVQKMTVIQPSIQGMFTSRASTTTWAYISEKLN